MFHNSNNPCFHGSCLVNMWVDNDQLSNVTKKVQDIRKGDTVRTPYGFSKVRCVIKTWCKDGKEFLVRMDNGLLVTQWHPIRYNGMWVFPANVGIVKYMDCEAIYSFVLETDHIMIIDNTECACLGHHIDGDVIGHEYFGTDKIIEDLKKLEG